MTTPKTLQEALALVPEYILLRPGVDVWREGDEYLQPGIFPKWHPFTSYAGLLNGELHFDSRRVIAARRRIPDDVREKMAKNIVEWGYNSNFWELNPFESWLLQGGRNA